jgi:hypothetical protein
MAKQVSRMRRETVGLEFSNSIFRIFLNKKRWADRFHIPLHHPKQSILQRLNILQNKYKNHVDFAIAIGKFSFE